MWYSHLYVLLSLQEGKLLMNASLKGNVKLMKLLLDLGVEVNHQDKVSSVRDLANVCCYHGTL